MGIKDKYLKFIKSILEYDKKVVNDYTNNVDSLNNSEKKQSKFTDPNIIESLYSELDLQEGEVSDNLRIGRLFGGNAETYYDFDTKQILYLTRLKNYHSKTAVGAVIEIKEPNIVDDSEYIQMYYMNGQFVNPEDMVKALGADSRLLK